MNNLHRELAPISYAAWASTEDEARRTFIRILVGRRGVDLVGPAALELTAVGTGHMRPVGLGRDRPPAPGSARDRADFHRDQAGLPAGRR